jgi:hypothetical protein
VATREKNKNTLFLIPDVSLQKEAAGQSNETLKRAHVIEDLGAHESTQETTQELKEER